MLAPQDRGMPMRGRFILILGIILALISGLLIFRLLSSKQAGVQPQKVITRKVVVAVQNLKEGDKVVPEAVTIMEKPVDEVPADALGSLEKTRGKFAKVDIYQGDVITEDMLASQYEIIREKPVSLVPPGKVAFTIKVDELSSVAYTIQPGDFVDVLVSFAILDVDQNSQVIKTGPEGEPQTPRYVAQLTLQNVEVLSVGLKGYGPPEAGEEVPPQGAAQAQQEEQPSVPVGYDYVTLILPQQDALVLKYLRETGAIIDLALRNPDDKGTVTTEAVTLEYIMRRFNIPAPPKLPYVSKSRSTPEEALR
ncbi:MAG TPA: Flp pilus assembly protein CpaB [Chloroflexi bacterium]|nr:Flp pilus assembly protein CpaB [Chloroflexota bacterium]